jgi:hypothetical protein
MEKDDKLIEWKDDERTDRNRNGIPDDIEPPIPDIKAGSAKLHNRLRNDPLADPKVAAGDPDVSFEDAQFAGDETATGDSPTPDQNVVDEIGASMGITYSDDEELKVGEKERERDKRRWELDPASSEDYKDRIRGND